MIPKNIVSREELILFKQISEFDETIDSSSGIFQKDHLPGVNYFRAIPQEQVKVGITGVENLLLPIDIPQGMYKVNKKLIDAVGKKEAILGTLSIWSKQVKKNKTELIDIITHIYNHYQNEKEDVPVKKAQGWEPDLFVDVQLHSSQKSINKMQRVNKQIQAIEKDPRSITKKKLETLLKTYNPLHRNFGDIRNLKVEKSQQIMDGFKEFVVKIEDSSYFVFAGKEEPIIIHMGEHKQHKEHIHQRENLKSVLEKLRKEGYIELNKKDGEEKLLEIENKMIMVHTTTLTKHMHSSYKKTYNKVKSNEKVGSMERMRFIQRYLMDELEKNNEWKELKSIMYDPKHFDFMSARHQLQYLKNASDSPYVQTVLDWARDASTWNVMKKFEDQNYSYYEAVDHEEEAKKYLKQRSEYISTLQQKLREKK